MYDMALLLHWESRAQDLAISNHPYHQVICFSCDHNGHYYYDYYYLLCEYTDGGNLILCSNNHGMNMPIICGVHSKILHLSTIIRSMFPEVGTQDKEVPRRDGKRV
ncbi:unnamed protein product [Gongylonema pulchrum]|uniref:SCP domain-containing protein n=1 Tax=Gongylonema pulchrum TaxID=637853 RepID=A0A183D423_9BILA|nr:unnamed protein product [Gongylonema pulchrum]